MAIRNIPTPKIQLNAPRGYTPLTMDMQEFFEFSFWMAEELLDLEAEFASWQTNASAPIPVFDANGLQEIINPEC